MWISMSMVFFSRREVARKRRHLHHFLCLQTKYRVHQIWRGRSPLTFLLSGGSPLTFDSFPSSPGGQLHRSSSGCGLPQAVMAGRKSLLSFGFSSDRAQQAASAGNSGSLPLDPAPYSESGEIPGLEGKQGNENLVDFTPLPESEPEEDSGFDFSETEDEESSSRR